MQAQVMPKEITASEKALAGAVDRDSSVGGTRLHLADSKQVYSPGRGLASLEQSALALLAQTGPIPQTFRELAARLTGESLRGAARLDVPKTGAETPDSAPCPAPTPFGAAPAGTVSSLMCWVMRYRAYCRPSSQAVCNCAKSGAGTRTSPWAAASV